MPWISGAIAAGGMLLSSSMSSDAAKDAAKGQTQASDQAVAEQRRQYDTTREDQMPWLQEGQQSIRTIGDLLRSGAAFPNFTGANLTSEPGYQFRLGEGNKAIENAARARGMYMSPMTVKDLMRYGQDYASGEYQNAYNRDLTNKTTKFNMLSGTSGTGQVSANAIGNAGANMAGNIGGLMTGAANARGAAGIASANAWGNGISNIGSFYQQQQNRNQQQAWMDRMFPQQTPPYIPPTYSGYGSSGDYQYG